MPALTRVRRRALEVRSTSRFFSGLRAFLSRPFDLQDARQIVAQRLGARELAFASVLERTVFQHPRSPYRRLLDWAGIGLGDVISWLAVYGLDRTLERLCDAGVYVSLEEFKGQAPVRRSGLEFSVAASDFDNPLARRPYEARTGGSTGDAQPVFIDLDLIAHETAYHALFLAAAGLGGRPLAIWHMAPPGSVGLKVALAHARLGQPVERWFSPIGARDTAFRHALFTRAMLVATTLYGTRVPAPEYTPARASARVAEWLSAKTRCATPGILMATPSSAVRSVHAALDGGLDISGSTFVTVGEPYSRGKAAVIHSAGCRGWSHYGMTEAGLLGIACLSASHPDDVHVLEDKMAIIRRDKRVGMTSALVPALVHTTLLSSSPKIMLNVESGDYGVMETRRCGCPLFDSGFTRHLHTIRSYEKLTCEGVHFLGGDLLTLVEDVLPAAVGGRGTDYQFVEREQDGLPRVSLTISPRIGTVDEDRVVGLVLAYLRRRGPAQRLMAEVWAKGRTLVVARGEPHATPGGKIPPLDTLPA